MSSQESTWTGYLLIVSVECISFELCRTTRFLQAQDARDATHAGLRHTISELLNDPQCSIAKAEQQLQNALSQIRSPDANEAAKKEAKDIVAKYLKAEFKADQDSRRGHVERLEKQVERIAHGNFETSVVSGPPDEVGLLASAVGSMATQLRQMWQTIHQREGERLLHQVAAGLAHNLRNSLTGARMAVELHVKRCEQRDDEGLCDITKWWP